MILHILCTPHVYTALSSQVSLVSLTSWLPTETQGAWKGGLLRPEALRGLTNVPRLVRGRTGAGIPSAAAGPLLFCPLWCVCMAESGEPGFVAECPQRGWACTNEFALSDGKFSWLLCELPCWTPDSSLWMTIEQQIIHPWWMPIYVLSLQWVSSKYCLCFSPVLIMSLHI